MRHLPTSAGLVVFLLVLCLCVPLYSQERLQISEFLAVNDTGLDDEDRDEEDWIEIHNAGAGMASLEGWYLTDTRTDLTKWQFPAVTLEPDGYLVVFASGKDRRDPAGELHTNFKLSGTGEYLGLVRPDGVTVASEYSPAYPIQAPDVSYGLSGTTAQKVLLAPGAPARALVPLDDTLELPPESAALRPWTLEDFDDSAWPSGTTGVGFGYPGLIGLDVSAMHNVNQTVYVRIPFVVDDPSEILGLTLRIRFDDGMIAYINGHEVARDNAPAPTTETWNSGAPDNWPDQPGLCTPMDFSIRRFDFLHVGTNVLAVQGLNNGLASPDLMVDAGVAGLPSRRKRRCCGTSRRLRPAGRTTRASRPWGRSSPTSTTRPPIPTQRDDLRSPPASRPASTPVASAQLRYRVMFGAEVTVPCSTTATAATGPPATGSMGQEFPRARSARDRWCDGTSRPRTPPDVTSRFPTFLDPLEFAAI